MANSASRITFHVSRLTFHALRFTFYALLITFLTACTVVRLTRPVVKIGLVGPFEGQYRYVGYDAIYAVRLALREANAAGGVGGYSVELVAYDDQGSIAGARRAARNLAQDPNVIAVIGHFRDKTTEAAQPLYDQAGLPLIVAGTVEGGLGEETDLLCPLLDYLEHKLASHRVQWISSDEAPPVCAEGPMVTVSAMPPTPNVDAVLLTLDPVAAGETLVVLRAAGWGGVVAGGPTLGSPLFTRIAGADAAGVVFFSPYPWPEATAEFGATEFSAAEFSAAEFSAAEFSAAEFSAAEFSAAYRSLGPHVSPPGPFALATYQATRAFLDAIETVTRQGETPNRQTLALHLSRTQAPTTTVYAYRWTPSGTPELIGP